MNPIIKAQIVGFLEEKSNEVRASILHLEHQKELPSFLRVLDLTDQDFKEMLLPLRKQRNILKDCLEELNKTTENG